jgi:hypothetical protein
MSRIFSIFVACALILLSIQPVSAQASPPVTPSPHSAILRITPPKGWVKEPDNSRCGCAPRGVYTTFRARDTERVRLWIHYPPWSASVDHLFLFAELMAKPAHILDAVERKHMLQATPATNAEIGEMRTADLRGRRVLIIEKTGKDAAYRERNIYVAAHGTGDDIYFEEISYGAPPEEYSQYLGAYERALASIVWNPDATVK